ncbi:MAG: signal peptidase II [Gammaproteobacteria bacterium]|jgi:signal peptidase II
MRHTGNLRWLWLSFIIVILDQWTKFLVIKHLPLNDPYAVIPFFNLTLTFNTGTAFSFLSSASGWQVWLLVGLAIMVCLLILVWLGKISRHAHWLAASLALIFGGALGNLIDRFHYGYVIDFIDLHVKNWHYPTFNVADTAICIGIIMLIISLYLHKSHN